MLELYLDKDGLKLLDVEYAWRWVEEPETDFEVLVPGNQRGDLLHCLL